MVIKSTHLLVLGEMLDPDEISNMLQVDYSQAWRRGDKKRRRDGPDGAPRYFNSLHEEGGWKIFSSDDVRLLSIEQQLDHWCGILERAPLWAEFLQQNNLRAWVDCLIITDSIVGVDFSSYILLRLSILNVRLMLTFQPWN
jgi:hypothetical protein